MLVKYFLHFFALLFFMVSRAFPAECKILSFLLAVGTKNVERRNLLPLSTNKLSNILFLLKYILSNLLERRNKYNSIESRSQVVVILGGEENFRYIMKNVFCHSFRYLHDFECFSVL